MGIPSAYTDINTPGRSLAEVKSARAEGEKYLASDLPTGSSILHRDTHPKYGEDRLWHEAETLAQGKKEQN